MVKEPTKRDKKVIDEMNDWLKEDFSLDEKTEKLIEEVEKILKE